MRSGIFACILSNFMILCVCRFLAARHCIQRQAVQPHFRKEVRLMPITLTFHIFGLVFTIKVKSENRHPGR